MIDGLTNSDAMPALERLMQFAARRQDLIANNIANITTPNFQPTDVSVSGFQEQLREAVDIRRAGSFGPAADLKLQDSEEVEFGRDGLTLNPTPLSENILFHDNNDRSVESPMQDMVENLLAFRTASQLHKSRIDLLNTAIRERI
jgi:flagellar basal-body rod protein FlgB